MKLFTAIVVLALTGIVGMNSCVDVAGLGTFDRVTELAGRQGEGDLVVWDNLFDQRAWLKAKLRATCPEVLILGSSTVGALRADMFAGHHIVNGWLSAPSIEDLEALTVVLERAGCHPADIVLGVDPWLLNAAFGDQRWLSLFDDYLAYRGGRLRAFGLALVRDWSVAKEWLNYATTRASIAALWRGARAQSAPQLVHMSPEAFCQTVTTAYYIRANDGHYVGCPAFLPSASAVEVIARGYVVANTHEIRHWKEIDADRMQRLSDVIRRWARSSHVVLLAPPYHPLTWAALRASAPIAANLDALDRSLSALGPEIEYVNARDPSIAGCSGPEFEDSHHGLPSCARRVAARVLPKLK